MIVKIVFQTLLWVWFLGCITTYRIGKYLLVEGEGIRSAEFIMACFYSAGVAAYHILSSAGKWCLFVILCTWLIIQFFCHWYYTIFGVSEKKLKGYNQCFKGTVRIWPMSDKRLIPDFYHTVLHILIAINILICIL